MSSTYPPDFLTLCIRALRNGPQEISINTLLTALKLSDNLLANIAMLEKGFEEYGLEVLPAFKVGSFDQLRVLKEIQKSNDFSESELRKIIEEGENHSNEFKSTLLLDLKKQKFNPFATPQDLKSEEVLMSSLKTIAGFLNWHGGNLLVGVEDNGNCLGIEKDYCFFKDHQQNIDGWELELRNQINGKFLDGNSVNQYINVSYSRVEDATVAVVTAHARKKLSFLRKNSEYVLYTRQSNSTRQINLVECEEYFQLRNTTMKY